MRITTILIALMFFSTKVYSQVIDTIYTKIPIRPYLMDFVDLDNGIILGNHPTNETSPVNIVTSDGGKNWKHLKMPHRYVHDADYVSIDKLLVLAGAHLYTSTDQGLTWDSTKKFDGSYLQFVDRSHGFSDVSRTTNGGESWIKYEIPPIPTGWRFSYGFQDRAVGFMAGTRKEQVDWSQLFVTLDSGNTWKSLIYNEGEKHPATALRAKDGNWLISFYDEDVYLRSDKFANVGKLGLTLKMDAQGNIYTSRGYRSTDNGQSFSMIKLDNELPEGRISIVDDTIIYISSYSDISDWLNVGHVIYRINSPSLAFGPKSIVEHRDAPAQPEERVAIARSIGVYRFRESVRGYALYSAIGGLVQRSDLPCDAIDISDLSAGLYQLVVPTATTTLLVY